MALPWSMGAGDIMLGALVQVLYIAIGADGIIFRCRW